MRSALGFRSSSCGGIRSARFARTAPRSSSSTTSSSALPRPKGLRSERRLAPLPLGGAGLAGLERLQNPHRLGDGAPDLGVLVERILNVPLGIDDDGRPAGDALLLQERAELARSLL